MMNLVYLLNLSSINALRYTNTTTGMTHTIVQCGSTCPRKAINQKKKKNPTKINLKPRSKTSLLYMSFLPGLVR